MHTMRGQWRYDKRTVAKPDDLPATLTRLDAEGWEVVDRISQKDGTTLLIVRREVVREIRKDRVGPAPSAADLLDVATKAARR